MADTHRDIFDWERIIVVRNHLEDCKWHVERCDKEQAFAEWQIKYFELGEDAAKKTRQSAEDKKRAFWSFGLVLFMKAFPLGDALTQRWLDSEPHYWSEYDRLREIRNRWVAHDGPTGKPFQMPKVNPLLNRARIDKAISMGNDEENLIESLTNEYEKQIRRTLRHYPLRGDIDSLHGMAQSAIEFTWGLDYVVG